MTSIHEVISQISPGPRGGLTKMAAPALQNLAMVTRIVALAEKKGCTVGQLALAWVQVCSPRQAGLHCEGIIMGLWA